MSNKYDNLVEEINKQEEIAEQKENLAEQLAQTTTNVNTAKEAASNLLKAADAAKEAAKICNTAALSTDNSVTAITNAILDARKVEVKHRLDDESIKQLEGLYNTYLTKQKEMLSQHETSVKNMVEHSKDQCYDIINQGDGAYFGRKTFIRLFICFMVFFGIILTEIIGGIIWLLGL